MQAVTMNAVTYAARISPFVLRWWRERGLVATLPVGRPNWAHFGVMQTVGIAVAYKLWREVAATRKQKRDTVKAVVAQFEQADPEHLPAVDGVDVQAVYDDVMGRLTYADTRRANR